MNNAMTTQNTPVWYRLVGLPAGRRTKWFILVLWLIVIGVAGPLAATFSVGAVLPEVGFLQLSLLVALGVLLDTFVVRTLLIPALALDAGSRIWWPDRIASPAAEPATARWKEPA